MQNFYDFIKIIKSKRSMDPLSRISLKSTKKTLALYNVRWPYCTMVYDMS